MNPQYSIVTTCKGRLEHLKESLPSMMSQSDCEVIVVDFSCPDGTAAFVNQHYPRAKVIRVEGRDYFSNWEARNAGATIARGSWIMFNDADVVLERNCISWIAKNIPQGRFGKFAISSELQVHCDLTTPLSVNNLQGFLVVERSIFEKAGGYDDLLKGYAAQGDTDLVARLTAIGITPMILPEALIQRTIEHDDALRLKYSGATLKESFFRALIYRELKRFLIPYTGHNLPRDIREDLFAAAERATRDLGSDRPRAKLNFILSKRRPPLASNLGYPKASITAKIEITLDLEGK